MLSRIPVLVIAALLLAGCESGNQSSQDPAQTGAQPPDAATTPAEPVRPAATGLSTSGGDALADGEIEINISTSGVTIRANAVSQQTILYQLATQAGFEIREAGVPWEDVTLTIDAADLHAALVALLKQYPYQIIYEFDTNRQADTLKRVVVGDTLAGQQGIQSTSAPDAGGAAGIRDYEMMPDANEATLSAEDQINLTLLLDPSPEVREEAAGDVEPKGIALDYLTRMVITDPSPEVRIAAALTLGDSEDPKALDTLVLALQDNDPRVLEEVIDVLGDIGNRSTIPYLQPLLNHPDEDVRDAAESAIDNLQ